MKIIRIAIIATAAALSIGASAQSQTVRAFSHRGGRLENDENTLSAFQISYDMGYTGFETDIRMTSDGVLIITHDNTLDRTTNGTGKVEETSWADIKKLKTKGGHKILTLEELSAFFKGKHIEYVEWELKTKPVESYPQKRLEEYCDKLYETVMKNKPEGAEYLFTSSDPRGLLYLRNKHPEVNLLIIFSKPVNDETINTALALGIDRIGCQTEGTSRAMVAKAKSKGLHVSLWPTKKIEDFVLGCYLGSEYLCTDIPRETMETMRRDFPWINVLY